MEEPDSVENIPDIFRPGQERAQIELDRIQNAEFFKKYQRVLDSFVFDARYGILGWWDADSGSWIEIWGMRQLQLGPMERWSYFPKDAKDEPISELPKEIDVVSKPPDLKSPLHAPYHVLKKMAMLVEQKSQ